MTGNQLLLRSSLRGHLPGLLFQVGFAVLAALTPLTGIIPIGAAVAVTAAVLAATAIESVGLVKARKQPWQVRLTAAGIQLRGWEPVPWSSIAEVRLSPLKPRWFYWFTPRSHQVIVLVPHRPGQVPAVVSHFPRDNHREAPKLTTKWRNRWYGSGFLLFGHTLDQHPRDVADAIDGFLREDRSIGPR